MAPRTDATDGAAPAVAAPRRLISTAEGTSTHPFTPADWGLLLIPSVIWGASFLLIAEGLEAFEPGVVTLLRIVFGFAALAAIPTARRTPIDRADRPRIALVGVVWIAFPMTMFPLAEQWISSSVTGMLNGSMPLFSAAVAGLLLRRPPGRNQLIGLAVGFAGVVAISLPSLQGGSRTALGAGLVVLAMCSYGFATNLVVPLQQRYGTVPVIWRAQAVAIVLTAPFGIAGIGGSRLEAGPLAAVFVLGAVGTGLAFIAAGTLMGRVGATRGSVLAYLIPVVALVLGVVFRDETVEAIAIAGLALVLVGAFLTTRAGR
ncbi:MAG TPA: DMT family transporter [Aquihabitans sp.]|jgi:drug/metabolite transporter (DMT)-like permease|nr:DMT family transporter [Aquihabitans sp.]